MFPQSSVLTHWPGTSARKWQTFCHTHTASLLVVGKASVKSPRLATLVESLVVFKDIQPSSNRLVVVVVLFCVQPHITAALGPLQHFCGQITRPVSVSIHCVRTPRILLDKGSIAFALACLGSSETRTRHFLTVRTRYLLSMTSALNCLASAPCSLASTSCGIGPFSAGCVLHLGHTSQSDW